MNSTLLGCGGGGGAGHAELCALPRSTQQVVRALESQFDFRSLGAKTDPTHFRHLGPSPIPPSCPRRLAHRAAFCFTSFPQNHWLLPCHRWNYVAMVFWPMKWHFQERSLVSVSPLFRVYKCAQAEGSSLLSRNLQNCPPAHPSTLDTTHFPLLWWVQVDRMFSIFSASNPQQDNREPQIWELLLGVTEGYSTASRAD